MGEEFEAGKHYYTRGGDIVQVLQVNGNGMFPVISDRDTHIKSGHIFETKDPYDGDLLLPAVTEDGSPIIKDSWENSRYVEREPRFDELNALRYNEGKTDFTLLPVDALEAESKVWMLGMEKYGRNNWEKLWGDETKNVVMQSAMRHMMAILSGEDTDNETGQPHAAHVRCNMAMLIRYYNETEKPNEDEKQDTQ